MLSHTIASRFMRQMVYEPGSGHVQEAWTQTALHSTAQHRQTRLFNGLGHR